MAATASSAGSAGKTTSAATSPRSPFRQQRTSSSSACARSSATDGRLSPASSLAGPRTPSRTAGTPSSRSTRGSTSFQARPVAHRSAPLSLTRRRRASPPPASSWPPRAASASARAACFLSFHTSPRSRSAPRRPEHHVPRPRPPRSPPAKSQSSPWKSRRRAPRGFALLGWFRKLWLYRSRRRRLPPAGRPSLTSSPTHPCSRLATSTRPTRMFAKAP
mmetsp:Transcript_22686/g.72687  ORF Transcript_22686/g.72687 Transcript_22686/m.72687 type:complete len:219 (-) Transcript_22686:354-1010(-)